MNGANIHISGAWGEGSLTALLARGTRTIRMCSFTRAVKVCRLP